MVHHSRIVGVAHRSSSFLITRQWKSITIVTSHSNVPPNVRYLPALGRALFKHTQDSSRVYWVERESSMNAAMKLDFRFPQNSYLGLFENNKTYENNVDTKRQPQNYNQWVRCDFCGAWVYPAGCWASTWSEVCEPIVSSYSHYSPRHVKLRLQPHDEHEPTAWVQRQMKEDLMMLVFQSSFVPRRLSDGGEMIEITGSASLRLINGQILVLNWMSLSVSGLALLSNKT